MTEIDNRGHIFDEDSKQFIEYAMKHHNVNDIPREERLRQYISYTDIYEVYKYSPFRTTLPNTILEEYETASLRDVSMPLSEMINSLCCDSICIWVLL